MYQPNYVGWWPFQLISEVNAKLINKKISENKFTAHLGLLQAAPINVWSRILESSIIHPEHTGFGTGPTLS